MTKQNTAYRTSTEQVPNKLRSDNPNILKLIRGIGKQELSVKEILEQMGMKHRPTCLENYLNPAFAAGYTALLYPNSPRHPRQKYLLTVKGLALYNEMISETGNSDINKDEKNLR